MKVLAVCILAAMAAGLTLLMIFLYHYVRPAFFLLIGVIAGIAVGLLLIWALEELEWLP